jgi:hypothetical protein
VVILLLVLAVLGAAPLAAADALVLGVLEQPQCDKSVPVAVRALFQERAEGWVALSSQAAWEGVSLARAKWTVTLEGRDMGSVSTVDPGFQTDLAWTFPRDRLLHVFPAQSVPTVAKDTARFRGWCEAPGVRPLVVLSWPNTHDPDDWKSSGADKGLRTTLFEEFKAHAGPASLCSVAADRRVPFEYTAKDLVVSPGYQDRTGRKVVVLGLDPQRNTCDGPPEPAWSTQAFLVDRDVKYLGADLTLVDAGDYDADGSSDLLFWHNSYNEDGYRLVYGGLAKHVDYFWRYH